MTAIARLGMLTLAILLSGCLQIPTSLKVNSSMVGNQFGNDTTANGCPSTPQQDSSGPFGMRVRVFYQILDQDEEPIRAQIPILENVFNLRVDGTSISGEPSRKPITSTGKSSGMGIIDDNAIGLCSDQTFGVGTFTQEIFVPGPTPQNDRVLRAHGFTMTGLLGCGNGTNADDVNVSVTSN